MSHPIQLIFDRFNKQQYPQFFHKNTWKEMQLGSGAGIWTRELSIASLLP